MNSEEQQMITLEKTEEYNSLKRSLQRHKGFGLFFIQCLPKSQKEISEQINQDILPKKSAVLHFTEPIDSLYDEIINLPNLENIDILFIIGLENSLLAYEQTFLDDKNSSTEPGKYSQSWQGVPRFLGGLNLQRERFQRDFDISLVFILPAFGINYFINRAPDFFDWRSGLFKFD